MEPSPCTLLVKIFPKIPLIQFEASQFGGPHNYKTKQNKIFSFINKCKISMKSSLFLLILEYEI
jgi:hypothetical protein